MTGHLPQSTLTALADGELSPQDLAIAKQHLDSCISCASKALAESMLKTAIRQAGNRYSPPDGLVERMRGVLSANEARLLPTKRPANRPAVSTHLPWIGNLGWAAAVVLVLAFGSWQALKNASVRHQDGRSEEAAIIREASDLHIATLAAQVGPEVLSSDRHTVKPWFQGKIPFAFNLPEALPPDTTLLGANLVYMNHQPIAQLIYSVGKHRLSVFLRPRTDNSLSEPVPSAEAGFQVESFCAKDLCAIAVSDVERSRLADLVTTIKQAQPSDQP